jgi:hypothetical protein
MRSRPRQNGSRGRHVSEKLEQRGLLPRLDAWEMRPGDRWQVVPQKQVRDIKCVATVIPVLLPGGKSEPRLPPFLSLFHAVDFGVTVPDPVDQLCFGITGERAEAQRLTPATRGAGLQTATLRARVVHFEFR